MVWRKKLMNLSLLISKYSWVIIVVGVIAWVTYMSLKRPTGSKEEPNPDKLSRLGLAIEKAKEKYENSNFKKNVADAYAPKPTEKKKKEGPNPYETKLDVREEVFKPIDF